MSLDVTLTKSIEQINEPGFPFLEERKEVKTNLSRFVEMPEYYQHRSLEKVYLFKAKVEGTVIKIYDISQNLLFKSFYSWHQLSDFGISRISSMSDPVLLRTIAEKKLLPKELLPKKTANFEAELVAQRKIDEWQSREPVPNFSLFKKGNERLAQANLRIVQEYVEEGEYEDALKGYSKALEYITSSTDYEKLPEIFGLRKDASKATLASLHLARYQIQEGSPEKAIISLENSAKNYGECLEIYLLLMHLYEQKNETKKAYIVGMKAAAILTKAEQRKAIALYKHLLEKNQCEHEIYSSLAELSKTPTEKAHLLFSSASYALENGNLKSAEAHFSGAKKGGNTSFIDELIFLNLLKKQKKHKEIPQRLLEQARTFEKAGQQHSMRKAYKMLFRIERSVEVAEKLIKSYEHHKSHKQQQCYDSCITLLMREKSWDKAEKCALKALSTANAFQQVKIYEKLEHIYAISKKSELKSLREQLEKATDRYDDLVEKEMKYRGLFLAHKKFEDAIALARILSEQGRTEDSVEIYYQASLVALGESNAQKIALCRAEIQKLDPTQRYLDRAKRTQLLTQGMIINIHEELQSSKQKTFALDQQKKRDDFLSEMTVFGANEWVRYIGNVGKEPEFPPDLSTIVNKPSSLFEGNLLKKTHTLVMIPSHINGTPVTLKGLKRIISLGESETGRESDSKTNLDSLDSIKEFDDKITDSYWLLMTNEQIPSTFIHERTTTTAGELSNHGSCHSWDYTCYIKQSMANKDLAELINKCVSKDGIRYKLPSILEATLSTIILSKKTSHYQRTVLCSDKEEGLHFSLGVSSSGRSSSIIFARKENFTSSFPSKEFYSSTSKREVEAVYKDHKFSLGLYGSVRLDEFSTKEKEEIKSR